MGHDSPIRSESSRRERSRSSHSTKSPNKEKPSNRRNPSKHTRSRSPVRATDSRSPSPRSKRLRRERDRSNHKDDKSSEKNYGKTRSPEARSESPRTRRLKRAESDKSEKLSDRGHERDRKSVRDAADDNGREREHHKSRHRSPRDEGNQLNEDDRRNDNDDDSVARMKAAAEALETKEKQKPSFELSGKLAAETNRVKGVTLLFTEPPDARKPEVRWRLYVFKGGEVLNEPLYVHRQTCYLFGRERRVADIPTDHPSCSKQHAVLQYRQVEKEQPDGMLAKQIRPYIMDLGSTNGTFINDNRIEAERYYELMEKDTLKFGNSSREYVLLHENSA